jgi:hypothetical protein
MHPTEGGTAAMSVRDDLTLMAARLNEEPGHPAQVVDVGGGLLDTNRIPAGDFYRALRLAVDLIERVAEENRQ